MKRKLFHLTQKELPIIKQKSGFSLVEVILSIALFTIIVTAFAEAILLGEQSTALSGARMRATFLAEEGLEIVRNIRDEEYANLVDGTYGFSIANNKWTFSGTQDVTDIFTRQITISSIDADTKNIISSVSWQQNQQRPGNVTLTTQLTNWHHFVDQAEYLLLFGSPEWTGQGGANPNLTGIQLQNIASFPITIDKMIVSWTRPIRNIQEIIIAGITVFDGSSASGDTVNITDFTLFPGNIYNVDFVKFDGNMKDSDLIVTFIMKDGTRTIMMTIHPPANTK